MSDDSPVRCFARVLGALGLLLPVAVARAQTEYPKYEVGFGYAFLKDVGDRPISLPAGWQIAAEVNANHWFGVALDVGSSYKSGGLRETGFLAGAQFAVRGGRFTTYLDGLAGLVDTAAPVAAAVGGGVVASPSPIPLPQGGAIPAPSSPTAPPSMSNSASTGWSPALQIGAGIGIRIGDRVSFRAGADFRNIFSDGHSFQQFRIVAGVSFGFGLRQGPQNAPVSKPLPRPLAEPASPKPAPRPEPTAPPAAPPQHEPGAAPSRPTAAATRRVEPPAVPQVGALPVSASLAHTRDLLRTGDYAAASTSFRDHLLFKAADKFTIAVGLYCDASHLERAVQDAGGAPQFFMIRARRRAGDCYGAYWGVFDSVSEANQAIGSVPIALQAAGAATIDLRSVLR